MGATNNIKEIIPDYQLWPRTCCQCNEQFNQLDTENNNWEIYYRTNNDTDWTNFSPKQDRGWIAIEIQLEHLNCLENDKEYSSK